MMQKIDPHIVRKPGRKPDPPEVRAQKLKARNSRPNAKYRKKPESKDCSGYAPGHFLSLVVEHNWPPNFVPSGTLVTEVLSNGLTASERSTRTRNNALEQGREYALGRVEMQRSPKRKYAPGWM